MAELVMCCGCGDEFSVEADLIRKAQEAHRAIDITCQVCGTTTRFSVADVDAGEDGGDGDGDVGETVDRGEIQGFREVHPWPRPGY